MTRRTELMPLESLKVALRNPKDHDLGEIAASIRRFGFIEQPVLDERTGRLLGGHGRLEALKALRKQAPDSPPAGVESQGAGGDWLVPVQRGWASKDDVEAEAALVAINSLVEAGGWNAPALEKVLIEISQVGGEAALVGTGYDAHDVDRILRELAGNTQGNEPTPEDESKPIYVRSGELWALGDHRLLVGDTTKPEDMARLLDGQIVDMIASDPPYAIYGSSTGIGADIADDKMVRPFFELICKIAHAVLKPFGHAYLFTDWRSYPALWEGAKRAELAVKNAVVWDKGTGGMGSMWANCYELAAFLVKSPRAKAMTSNEKRGHRQVHKPNMQRHNRVTGEEREHNAAKPVPLLLELLDASSDKGDLVLDYFLGSGSTLIACEQSGRRCLGMEIEPKHAQTTLERWKRTTGHTPELVNIVK